MSIEQDLAQLEHSLREIQIEWEKFFGGVEKRPPLELKARLEDLIRRHANAEIRNNAQRFRYQSLTARYTTFAELWAKRLRAVEEGRPLARGVKLASRTPAAPLESAEPLGAAACADDEASPLEELLGLPEPAARPRPRPAGEYRVSDPSRELRLVRALFEDFVAERQKTGEPSAVKFDSFQKLIAQQAARILRDKGASAVDFRLETKDGKVSLKAKPVK